MPSRIIREQICTSDTLAKIPAEAERLFWRLVVQADDFGLFDARPKIVLGKCMTSLIGSVTEDDVVQWLDELEEAGLIIRYRVDGRPYLKLATWERHQRPPKSTSKPRHPLPSPGPSPDTPGDSPDSQDVPGTSGNCREFPGSFGTSPEVPAKGYRVKGIGYRVESTAGTSGNDSDTDPAQDLPAFSGDIDRDAALLVQYYGEYSPVTGKDAVRMNVRRNREMTAALRAGCKPETLAAVIRELAPLDTPPWEIRVEACKRDGIGKPTPPKRASPDVLDYQTWRRLFLNAASRTYTEDELKRMYQEEAAQRGAS